MNEKNIYYGEQEMIPCHTSHKTKRRLRIAFSPSWEGFCPAMLPFDLYFEECEQKSECQDIDNKHISIIARILLFQNHASSLSGFCFLENHFLNFFGGFSNTFYDELRDDNSTLDHIFMDIPDPTRIDHFDCFIFCHIYIIRMHKPFSPVFWMTARACIRRISGLQIINMDEDREEIELAEFTSVILFDIFLGKRFAVDKFLDDVGGFFTSIFSRKRSSVSHIFLREKIMFQRTEFREVFGDIEAKSAFQNIRKYSDITSQSHLKSTDIVVFRIMREALIEISEIAAENEIILILSPSFLVRREKSVPEKMKHFLDRFSFYAFFTQNTRYIHIKSSFL